MFFIFRIRFAFITTLCLTAFLFFFQQQAFANSKIVINKGTNQLAFFKDGYLLDVFPVATGRLAHYTPDGTWKVVVKLVNPSWRDPRGGPVIPGGTPANPLGPRWLGLNALGTGGSSYGVHGTNSPSSIGTYASSGCIRLYNKDILWLYERVPMGTEVEIINSSKDLNTWKKFSCVVANGVEPDYAPHLGPVQAGETTYLPLRPTATVLGYRLLWDGPTGTILISNIDREVILTLDSNIVTLNNTVLTAEETPFLLENITFVPLNYFQHFLGTEIYHDTESRTISLATSPDPSEGRLQRHNVTVKVNGNTVDLPETFIPLTDGENLLVPVRPVCASLGAAVNWNDATKSVEIQIRESLLSIPEDGSPAWLNGAALDTPSGIFIRNGLSFADLRFLAEVLCFQAEVDHNSYTENISQI